MFLSIQAKHYCLVISFNEIQDIYVYTNQCLNQNLTIEQIFYFHFFF